MSLFVKEETAQYFKSKGDFLKGFEDLQKKMQSKNFELLKEEREEITRIIKEFDYKNYSKRYYIVFDSALAALIGAIKANKELIACSVKKDAPPSLLAKKEPILAKPSTGKNVAVSKPKDKESLKNFKQPATKPVKRKKRKKSKKKKTQALGPKNKQFLQFLR